MSNKKSSVHPPKCARCHAPAHNVRGNGEYIGEHHGLEECLRLSTGKHRLLAEQVSDLAMQVSRLAELASRGLRGVGDVQAVAREAERLSEELEVHYDP